MSWDNDIIGVEMTLGEPRAEMILRTGRPTPNGLPIMRISSVIKVRTIVPRYNNTHTWERLPIDDGWLRRNSTY